jgi:predicted nucleic acid-binding protein
MKVLLDTSVLIAAFVEGHPDHERALPRIPPEGELYAVTVLPIIPRGGMADHS